MQKRFCDFCEEALSSEPKKIELISETKVYCDDKAKVTVSLITGFHNHSTGFGGPPDLCLSCMIELIDEIKEKAITLAERFKNQ